MLDEDAIFGRIYLVKRPILHKIIDAILLTSTTTYLINRS